jgi:hypothetical protein
MAFIAPAVGIAAVVLGIVWLRLLAARHGGLRDALRTQPRDVNVAYLMVLIGVTLVVGSWVVYLEPDNFPWQPVSAVIGLTALVAIFVRSRRGVS